MAGSFDIFRKYQRSLLVAVAILAMLAFFVLPPFLQMGSNAGFGDPVAVSWRGGEVRESQLERAVALQAATNRFVVQSAMAAGRDPSRLSLFPETEEAVMRVMLLAQEARENGVVVSDQAVNDYLSQVTNDMVRPEQLSAIISGLRIGPLAVSQSDIFSALRNDRAAWATLIMSQAAFSGNPPAWRWDAFRKLEQAAVVEVVPVEAASLVDDVKLPSEPVLRAFFKKFSEDLPQPASPNPGFREPHRVKVSYLVAKRKAIEEAVAAEVTDEKISEYYEKNKEKLFRVKDEDKKEQDKKEDEKEEDKKEGEGSEEGTDAEKEKTEEPNRDGFEPLEKVRDKIREELVRERAEAKVDQIFSAIAGDITGYAEDLAVWQARGEKEIAAPRAPDTEAIAKIQGLEAASTGLVSVPDASAIEGIGRSFEFIPDAGSRFGVRQQSWLEMMFGRGGALLRPSTSRDVEGNRYLSWKTEDAPEATPSFEDARPNVEKAWKIVEARALARQKAEEIVGKANAGHSTLEAAVAGRPDLKATQVGPFTWLTQGTAPVDAAPVLSSPRGTSFAGEGFMKAVFNLEPGTSAVVFNEPETICYCVRLVSLEPSVEDLRKRFFDQRMEQERLSMVAQREYSREYGEWLDGLDRKYAVEWKRPPRKVRGE